MKIGAAFSAVGAAMLASSSELVHVAGHTKNRWTQAALLVGAGSAFAVGSIVTLASISYAYQEWKSYQSSGLPELLSPDPYEPVIVLNEGKAELRLEPMPPGEVQTQAITPAKS